MEKIMFLIKGSPSETYTQFKDRVFELLYELVKTEKPVALKLVITDFPSPKISVIPFRNQKIASVSVWQNFPIFPESLLKIQGLSGVYRVTEALPVAYEKTWKDGEPTPGVCFLTLLRKKK